MFEFLKDVKEEVKAVNRFTGEVYVHFTYAGSFLEHTMFNGSEPGIYLTEVYINRMLEDVCYWCADVGMFVDGVFVEHEHQSVPF